MGVQASGGRSCIQSILDELAKDSAVKVVRAPKVAHPEALYEGVGNREAGCP